jgi:GNAT superfamily N-acetyltransferase
MTAVSREGQAATAAFSVSRLEDRTRIRAMLEPSGAYAAYALAQMDPRLYPLNEWFLSHGPSGADALLVHSRSGLGRAMFAIGDPGALDAALSLHPGPRFAFATMQLDHKPIIQRRFMMTRPGIMLRMAVTRETFFPAEGDAVRLRPRDVPPINRLYSAEGGPTAYDQGHLEEGVYWGVVVDGMLVSIAGTHVYSPVERVAVVGNVFTHPRYRGGGLGKIATSAVTEDLLQHCDLVALTVEEANSAAVSLYTRIGYRTACKLHETPLIRKDPLGLASAVRRGIAAWRGRREGKELVAK